MRHACAVVVAITGALLLQGCVAGAVIGGTAAVVGAGAAVVGGTAKATGAVVGAGVDAVTTSDAETQARAEREQRRCEQRRARGQAC